MAQCADGHQTQADDFCDQCGMPVVAAGAPARLGSPSPAPVSVCPHCGAPRIGQSLFCESCGYDYTTGALPQQDLRAELGLEPAEEPEAPHQTAEPRPQPGPAPAAAAADAPGAGSAAANAGAASPGTGPTGTGPTGADAAAAAPEADAAALSPAAAGASSPGTPVPGSADARPATTGATGEPSPADAAPTGSLTRHVTYVAEVWVDPQWYAFQESADPMPPQGPPRIITLRDSALIGRRSVSRNIHPDIDCEPDAGCSRRQAYLTSAGGYWYINDLDSANGTYVAPATAALPTEPITGRTLVGPNQRIYLGAWTRLVVRPAIAAELSAHP